MSTRSVECLVQAACRASPRARSPAVRRIGQRLLDRSLEGDWPYRARRNLCEGARGRRIVSVAVTVAVAVNDQGRREVLGMAASRPRRFWPSSSLSGAGLA